MISRIVETVGRGAVVDSAAAVGLTCLAAYATLAPPGPPFAGPPWLAWLVAAATGLSVAIRRRWPMPVLIWVTVATAVATASGAVGLGVIWVAYLPVALVLYSAAATAPGPISAFAALAGCLIAPSFALIWLYARLGITPADAPGSEAPLWWQVELGMVLVVITAAWLVGWTIRWRRSVQADMAERQTRAAVAAERLRIARELHDIVGHSMSLIAVKATVANHIADERPAETRAALVTIERTSQAALSEIRRLLGVLRSESDPAELGPSPGIDDLPELADSFRSSDVRVELAVDVAEGLPPVIDLAVFRIVQESLTNVMKHAYASRCQVTVSARYGLVRVEVMNDGRAQHSPGRRPPGQGLVGMRERVTMYGGTLITEPVTTGGFRVVAEIPYDVVETS